jgi:soluble epoxide hydrolase / lipid-phosphate phosphatase
MDQFTKKTFVTSRDLTYTYYHHTGADSSLPTLLLQHGFPDDHTLWSKVVPYLLELPYPILIPDLLGYNGTSKPKDVALYNSKVMTADLFEILDHEGIDNIVSVGHDWGAFLAGRLWLWHPERVVAVILLNVAYVPPSRDKFDLDVFNDSMEKLTGLRRYSYWYPFTAPYGAQLLKDKIESFWTALHGEGNNFEDTLCHPGALEDYLRNNKTVPVRPYAQDTALKDAWISRLSEQGFEGPLNWYKAQLQGIHWEVEKDIPVERLKITVPVLFIAALKDAVCLKQNIYFAEKAGLLPDLKIEDVVSGHWQTLEAPEKTGPIMATFLTEKESVLRKAKI